MKLIFRSLFLFIATLFFVKGALMAQYNPSSKGKSTVVKNMEDLKAALKMSGAGDTVLLASGIWRDVDLVIDRSGTSNRPLVVGVQKPGETFLSGNSFVKIGGDFVVVQDLHFVEGYTVKNPVIEFKKSDAQLANNCRVTRCVIENYSKPNRSESDSWIVFWGKNNRLDHCVIGNKFNTGASLIVNLNDERSQDNHHLIDSNFFHQRSPLGSNGGETIRIGVSRYSLTNSRTIVRQNFFYRSSGEVEIVSVKSGANLIEGNVFYECEGGLVLRHGDNNVLRKNIFIGNDRPFTGGIRVINTGHTIEDNLFYALKGTRFHAPFSLMNGVPNSPINRYVQVKNVTVRRNVFVDCTPLLFGAGKDPERTMPPENVLFENNQFVFHHNALANGDQRFLNWNGMYIPKWDQLNPLESNHYPIVELNGENKDIQYQKNYRIVYNHRGDSNTVLENSPSWAGIATRKEKPIPQFFRGKELLLPPLPFKPMWIDEWSCTPYWWRAKKEAKEEVVASSTKGGQSSSSNKKRAPQSFYFQPGEEKALMAQWSEAVSGDSFLLRSGGIYAFPESLTVQQDVFIGVRHANGEPALWVNAVEQSRAQFLEIKRGISLRLQGIHFISTWENKGAVQSAITTAANGLSAPYKLNIQHCRFTRFNETNYACIKATKGTYADSVVIQHSVFAYNSGMGIDFGAERDDQGVYNVGHLLVYNCVFFRGLNSAAVVYRGGNDESTTGPEVVFDRCSFIDVDNRMQGVVLKCFGAQQFSVTRSLFYNSGSGGRAIWLEEMAWDKIVFDQNLLYGSGRVGSFFGQLHTQQLWNHKPEFNHTAPFDYRLKLWEADAASGKAAVTPENLPGSTLELFPEIKGNTE